LREEVVQRGWTGNDRREGGVGMKVERRRKVPGDEISFFFVYIRSHTCAHTHTHRGGRDGGREREVMMMWWWL